jgi:LexA-binding, inner membrane-associated putative hydrolase
MFVGHFAVALAAKRAAPRAKLGTLVMAAQWLDLLWPIFLLLGLEQVRPAPGITRFSPFDFVSYPYTHNLAAVVGWAVLLSGIYFLLRRDQRTACVIGVLVVSHWILDWFTHRPDLPLYPSGPKVGLGLWNSVAATLIVELLIFAVGINTYLKATRAKDRTGTLALWGFLIILLLLYVASSFGSDVPSQKQIAWGGLTMWIFIPWGYWIDRHREVRV